MSSLLVKTIVSVSQTRKVNLGNYESADIQIGVSYETFDRAEEEFLYAKAADFVEERLEQEILTLQKKSVNPVTQKKAEEAQQKLDAAKSKEKPEAKPVKEKTTTVVKPKAKEEPTPSDDEDEVEEKVPAALRNMVKPIEAKANPAEEATDDDEVETKKPTLSDVKEALRAYAASTSKKDAIALMVKVTGKDKSDNVKEKDYAKLLLELSEAQEEI